MYTSDVVIMLICNCNQLQLIVIVIGQLEDNIVANYQVQVPCCASDFSTS